MSRRRSRRPRRSSPAVRLPLTVLLVSVTYDRRRFRRPRQSVARRAVAADRAVGQRHVDRKIPPPSASSPAVRLPLTVLSVSVTS